MKSAKTKIVFGTLDLIAAGCLVLIYYDVADQREYMLVTIPFLWGIPVLLYDLRPLIRQGVGRYELGICCGLALAGISMPNAFVTREFYGGNISESLWPGVIGMNVVNALALLVFIYALYWRIPLQYISAIALRYGVMPVACGFGVLTFPSFFSGNDPEARLAMIFLGVLLLYLIEVILYLRTGWLERTQPEQS